MKTILGFLDFYKVTMAYFAWLFYPSAVVKYAFHNRHSHVPLGSIVDLQEVRDRLSHIRQHLRFDEKVRGFIKEQLVKKGANPEWVQQFIEFLARGALPELFIEPNGDQIRIETEGPWPLSIWWETIVLSVANELRVEAEAKIKNLSLEYLMNEGDRLLIEKIGILKDPRYNEVRIMEFGLRRRASQAWQRHVYERLMNELPEGMLMGTSNVELAMEHGQDPHGTMAHELFMVVAAIMYGTGKNELQRRANLLRAQSMVLHQWEVAFGGNLTIALSDTFGTPSFLDIFGPFAKSWQGVRQDSGSSLEFGNTMAHFWRREGITPSTKTIVFSDGLTAVEIVGLDQTFRGMFKRGYGWGTNLTFDFGGLIKPTSNVMKAVSVNGHPTVKLSDTPGKVQGPPGLVKVYQEVFGYDRVKFRNITITY